MAFLPVDIINENGVARQGNDVVVFLPPDKLTPDQALVFAAWLVVLAEHDAEHTFDAVLEAVRNT